VNELGGTMRKRKTMTPKDMINKNHYRAIFYLIWMFQKKKIKFIHLRYALVENHDIVLTEKKKQELDAFFGNELKRLPRYDWFEGKIKGERGVNNLTNLLKNLEKMKMIDKDKTERFPSYKTTKLGRNTYSRWYAKWVVDQLIPDEKIVELCFQIGYLAGDVEIKNLPIYKKPGTLL
jgi:hypothetical protein